MVRFGRNHLRFHHGSVSGSSHINIQIHNRTCRSQVVYVHQNLCPSTTEDSWMGERDCAYCGWPQRGESRILELGRSSHSRKRGGLLIGVYQPSPVHPFVPISHNTPLRRQKQVELLARTGMSRGCCALRLHFTHVPVYFKIKFCSLNIQN